MILYGKPVAEKIYQEIKEELKGGQIQPFLAVILVGEDKASHSYVRVKEKKAEELGIKFELYHFTTNSLSSQIIDQIQKLNENPAVAGIIVQLPLPEGLDQEKILQSISPQKDTDGLNSENPAPTAAAILKILDYYNIDYKNLKMVIVGRGKLVGGPLEKMLTARGIEPLVCDSKTDNLTEITSKADILISATGVPGLIKADMVSEKAIVIDAGTAESKGEMKGDVDKEIYQKAKAYSPVPGGVGPLTVAMLMKNLVEAANLSTLLEEKEK